MELESGPDSVSSTPRSHKNSMDDNRSVVRMMCSFGGKILPRPHDNQLRYVGGDTRIVAVHRSSSFSSLLSKLSTLTGNGGGTGGAAAGESFTVKYQLPSEDLDALITVSTDEDVENMMEEFDRLSSNSVSRNPRLRLFLFPNNGEEDSRTSSIASLLDGSRKRENWFFDALNGGRGSGATVVPPLERGRSEASSIVSEVPDYLFGLDNSDEPPPVRFKNRTGTGLSDIVSGSAPGSPAVGVSASSPFGSTSSAPSMPNLPPVKTRPVEEVAEPAPVQYPVGFTGGGGGPVWSHHHNNNNNNNPAPGSPYTGHHHPMQAIPVYYVSAGQGPGPIPVQRGNPHMQAVPVSVPGPGHYMQQYGPGPGQGQVQVPVGYPGSGPMYGGGPVRSVGAIDPHPYEMQMQGNMIPGPNGPGQPMYYGVKNSGGGMVGGYPGMGGVPMTGEEMVGSGPDGNKARSLPA